LEKTAGIYHPSGNKPLFCLILRRARVNLALRNALKMQFSLTDQRLNFF
jgi:hypothetical protein